MTKFDPDDKDNKQIMDYLQSKTILICDQSSVRQSTIQKMLVDLGSKLSNVKAIGTISKALDLLKKNKYDYVFSSLKIGDESGLDLLTAHLELRPQRRDSGFFIISEENSPSNASVVLDYEVDAFVPCPCSIDGLLEVLLNAVKVKIEGSPFTIKFEEAKTLMFQNDLPGAYAMFEEAVKLTDKPVMAHAYMGKIHIIQEEFDKAREQFEEGLKIDDKNYKCISNLFELYIKEKKFAEAYKQAKQLLKHFPLNPKKFPDLVKVCIATEEFADILKLCEAFLEIETEDSTARLHLAAGMAMSGRFLVSKKRFKQGKEVMEKAVKLACSHPKVIKTVLETLIRAKEVEFAKTIITKFAKNVDYELMYYEIQRKKMTPEEIISFGTTLIDRAVQETYLFEDVVQAMRSLNKPPEEVDRIINIARKDFPELAEKLVEPSPAEPAA